MRVASFNFSFFCILKWVCFKSPNKSFPGHVQKASSVSTWTSMYKWASLLSLRRCASIRLKWKENDYLKQGCFENTKLKKVKFPAKWTLNTIVLYIISFFVDVRNLLSFFEFSITSFLMNHSHCILFTRHFT